MQDKSPEPVHFVSPSNMWAWKVAIKLLVNEWLSAANALQRWWKIHPLAIANKRIFNMGFFYLLITLQGF